MRRMYSKPQLLEAVEQESKINGIKVFEDIKDKDGHARFIEGDITIATLTGFTQTYGKWSLSGSHLLIVVAVEVASGTYTSERLCEITLPTWIFDKIYPLYGTVVDYKPTTQFNGGIVGTFNAYLGKDTGVGKLFIQSGSQTPTQNVAIRYSYDLLIDNE